MIQRRRIVGTFAAALWISGSFGASVAAPDQNASAPADDGPTIPSPTSAPAEASPLDAAERASRQLSRARENYERATEGIRKTVRAAIDRKLERASRPGSVDAAAITQAEKELAEFLSSGSLPNWDQRDAVEQRFANACKDMTDAFDRSRAASLRDDQEVLAQAIAAERDSFVTQWDLAPWRSIAIPGTGETQAGLPLEVATQTTAEYRIEIRGKAEPGATGLRVDLPRDVAEVIGVPITIGDDGSFWAVMTVRRQGVMPDLGMPRPLTTNSAASQKPGTLRVDIAVGKALIESIRYKPVVPGEPPEVRSPQRPSRDEPDAEDPDARYRAGLSWTGKFQDDDVRTIRLVDRNGDRVVFEVPGSFQGSLWRISGRLRRGVLLVDDVERIRNPPGHPPLKTHTPRGSIRINRDGTLDMNVTVRGSDGRNNNWLGPFRTSGATP